MTRYGTVAVNAAGLGGHSHRISYAGAGAPAPPANDGDRDRVGTLRTHPPSPRHVSPRADGQRAGAGVGWGSGSVSGSGSGSATWSAGVGAPQVHSSAAVDGPLFALLNLAGFSGELRRCLLPGELLELSIAHRSSKSRIYQLISERGQIGDLRFG